MSKSLLSNKIFNDEAAAREWLEARLWKDGRPCPHCGVLDNSTLMKGKSHRPGLYQCNACREPFSVTVGTLYERSHIPLHKWLAATHLLMASKKGMAAIQIGRLLGISKKSSWFMVHRIRESLREGSLDTPFGQGGKIVEADETYYGKPEVLKTKRTSGAPFIKKGLNANRRAIVSLVERGGRVKSFHVSCPASDDAAASCEAPRLQPFQTAPTSRGACRYQFLSLTCEPLPCPKRSPSRNICRHYIQQSVSWS